MKIAIAGPGRSGTSFLTKLFSAWGFDTPPGEAWHQDAQAGMESRIGSGSGFEIDKDPWLYEYIDRLSADQIHAYDAVIIPIRSLNDAAESRSIQERLFRLWNDDADSWLWNSFGTVPGGAVSDTSASGVAQVLTDGLWAVVERLSFNGVQPIILNFPRIASDFTYLWNQIGHLVQARLPRDSAEEIYYAIAEPRNVRTGQGIDEYKALSKSELVSLIEQLRSKAKTEVASVEQQIFEVRLERDRVAEERDRVAEERDRVAEERDRVAEELHNMVNTLSWRVTGPLRMLRRKFR